MGLKGYVWREPNAHGKILAIGTRYQLDSLISFAQALQHHHFITTFVCENHEFAVFNESFDILPSRRRHVQTGQYSDQAVDEVFSMGSADLPMLRGSPSENC